MRVCIIKNNVELGGFSLKNTTDLHLQQSDYVALLTVHCWLYPPVSKLVFYAQSTSVVISGRTTCKKNA